MDEEDQASIITQRQRKQRDQEQLALTDFARLILKKDRERFLHHHGRWAGQYLSAGRRVQPKIQHAQEALDHQFVSVVEESEMAGCRHAGHLRTADGTKVPSCDQRSGHFACERAQRPSGPVVAVFSCRISNLSSANILVDEDFEAVSALQTFVAARGPVKTQFMHRSRTCGQCFWQDRHASSRFARSPVVTHDTLSTRLAARAGNAVAAHVFELVQSRSRWAAVVWHLKPFGHTDKQESSCAHGLETSTRRDGSSHQRYVDLHLRVPQRETRRVGQKIGWNGWQTPSCRQTTISCIPSPSPRKLSSQGDLPYEAKQHQSQGRKQQTTVADFETRAERVQPRNR